MLRSSYIWPIVVVIGVITLTATASRTPTKTVPGDVSIEETYDLEAVSNEINRELQRRWDEADVSPADLADDLTVLRRLSLSLHGTVPSLEEIRLFEADVRDDKIAHWTASMLEDDRFVDYFAERLARSYVGVVQGQFLVFRRDRFTHWLREQIRAHVPYDQIVRQMISGEGIWTGQGEVNFITSAFDNDEFDANKLTARTTRAFLGQRIDCAQCHDHPFDHWTQDQFQGLTAHFAQVELSLAGVTDNQEKKYEVLDEITSENITVDPAVPFNPEWMGETGTRRERLARWVTHPENKRFERAIANRVWALMFGKSYLLRPVDDLPDPEADEPPGVLDILGQDFRKQGYDLRRLIQAIASSRAFRMQSSHPLDLKIEELQASATTSENEIKELNQQLDLVNETWAMFPLIRLRPEQVIGAMLQSNKVHTVDQNSHLVTRAIRFFRETDFVDAFGDPGVDELQDRTGTIPQALLRMNGNLTKELINLNPLAASARILAISSSDEIVVENCYLACLTRRPTQPEVDYFVKMLAEDNDKNQDIEDLYWTLFNAPEFSWAH